jgi:RNA polymerase sigma factor (TIGR02999 family)
VHGNVAAKPEWHVAEITELIGKARGGDQLASERLFAMLYDELRRMAAGQLRGDNAMRATSLVHEAYLKLAHHGAVAVNDRSHYFAVASRVMRQIVIDHVLHFGPLDTTAFEAVASERDEEILALDAALVSLAAVDEKLAALVEMRFYAGLELSEIADVQDRSERSLKRDWRKARAFLQRELVVE